VLIGEYYWHVLSQRHPQNETQREWFAAYLDIGRAISDASDFTKLWFEELEVSNWRCRYPLRWFVRSALRWPYPAPHKTSASAPIKVWMNMDNNSRSTSGEVVVSRSASSCGQSISWAVVIACIPLLE
jgi:hypothetical protein